MSKTLKNPKVGDYVYRPFEILKPGKVISIREIPKNDPWNRYYVTVKWLDGSSTEEQSTSLSDFNFATDEHLRKFQKFDALRNKLNSI